MRLDIVAAALCAGVVCADAASASPSPVELTVEAGRSVAEVQPTMYGLFFEDINFAADGGLYAEKVKNRSFEFPDALAGWHTVGNVEVRTDGAPFDRCPHYVRLSPERHREKLTAIENEGFFGVSVSRGEVYRFSVWARGAEGDDAVRLRVAVADPGADGDTQEVAAAVIAVDTPQWTKYTAELKPSATVRRGVLRLMPEKGCRGTVDVEHVSLMPVDTWHGHENGLRRDIAEKLAAVRPGVFRFPGGCIVEGTELGDRYQWKNTVGPVENRPLNLNRWQYTFADRMYPDYFQSGGLGFYEYFLLAEEIGAEPLPVINAGLVCQYQNRHAEAHADVDSLECYIQDAIDLIEFANGDTCSTWGALRRDMGHAEPFGLKMIAIGNEQWGEEYVERLEQFVKALREVHPEIRIVGSAGPHPDGDKFDYLWPEMKRMGVDLVDEHFYRPAEWFLESGARYDSYDRTGPKVFAGEYACHIAGKKRNHFYPALLEAAFMTGLERNADVVEMATYAPLLAHVEGWQWRPDMIWFDNLESVATASYYVQKLYGENRGTDVVRMYDGAGRAVAGTEGQHGLFASAVADRGAGTIVVKIVNTSAEPADVALNIKGIKRGVRIGEMEVTTLSAPTGAGGEPDLDAENTLENQWCIVPEVSVVALDTPVTSGNGIVEYQMAPYSFAVLKFKNN